jgi:hypothetical protein
MDRMHSSHWICGRAVWTALGVAALSQLMPIAADGASREGREYYELRAYRLRPEAPDHALLDGYLSRALIPAINARGIKAVGAFTEPEAKDGPAVWILIPHATIDSMAAVAALNADPALLAKAGEYLTAPTKNAPAFARLDTWLLLAFAGMTQHEIPSLARDGKSRIYELRVYESYSEAKGRKKVDMFNAGEIDLFREVGFAPVFFGEAMVGDDLPHLAYMLCSPDRATHDAAWKAFFAHETWLKLKNDPQYADTVSKVVSRFLVPTAYSQM